MTTKRGTTFVFRAMPIVFAMFACMLGARSARAQSTIFNIPSTDTVDKGKGYFEFDSLPQAPTPTAGSIVVSNPRFLTGLPHDVVQGQTLNRNRGRLVQHQPGGLVDRAIHR